MDRAHKIKAILVDCGDVIWDDCPAGQMMEKELFLVLDREGLCPAEEDFFAAKKAAVQAAEPDLLRGLVKQLYGTDNAAANRSYERMLEWHTELHFDQYAHLNPLREGARQALGELHATYTLAVAANQPPRAKQLLRHYNVLDCFDYIGISDLIGLSKPDPAFYQQILHAVACEPGQAVMIGDRYDNDIKPANELGMTTLRFACKSNRWQPKDPPVQPDHVVYSWQEILDVVNQIG